MHSFGYKAKHNFLWIFLVISLDIYIKHIQQDTFSTEFIAFILLLDSFFLLVVALLLTGFTNWHSFYILLSSSMLWCYGYSFLSWMQTETTTWLVKGLKTKQLYNSTENQVVVGCIVALVVNIDTIS